MKNVKIFYTGGFDSTFRILQLSRQKVIIQPFYVIDKNRKSLSLELERMHKIIKSLEERKDTYAKFSDITIVEKDEIPHDETITKAFNFLQNNIRIGGQYEWLGRLAKLHPGIELGIEKTNGEYSGCSFAIEKYGQLKEEDGNWILNKECSSNELSLVFGNFSFPIYYLTEVEMVNWIKKYEYEDIMSLIWFCHHPINNQPCGICRPCQQKMECGMEFLVQPKAKKRYKFYTTLNNKSNFLAKTYSRLLFLFH